MPFKSGDAAAAGGCRKERFSFFGFSHAGNAGWREACCHDQFMKRFTRLAASI